MDLPKWGPERDLSARTRWCTGSPYCPANLVKLLASNAVGRTLVIQFPKAIGVDPLVTLTVIGGGNLERAFARDILVPVLVECVRVLAQLKHTSMPVHVSYCNACGQRLLPVKQGAVLSSEHVNGGMAMGPNMGVLVFRREDAAKVLVHELLHLYGIDAPLRNIPSAIEACVVQPRPGMWGLVQGSLPVGLSEAYTDAIACMVFCGNVQRATEHAVHTASKVLAHFRYGLSPFVAETHAFSYYVVKAAMLTNASTFLKLLSKQRDGLTPDGHLQVVCFMEKALRSVAFRSAVKAAGGEGGKRHAQDRHIRMTDGGHGQASFSEIGVLI